MPWIRDAMLQALDEANQTEDWKTRRNHAKRLARKDKVNWVHEQLAADPDANRSTVWNTVRKQRKAFVGKRSHLVKDG